MTRRSIYLLLILLWVPTGLAEVDYEHYRQAEPLRIGTVQSDRTQAGTYERVTLNVDLQASFDNPFDRSQIAIDATVTESSGRSWTAPGFFYAPYKRDDSARKTRLTTSAGKPSWQVRLSFARAGRHKVVVTARDRTGKTQSQPLTVDIRKSDSPSMIRRHESDHRYFVTDRGKTWFAVGANVCWGETWGDGGRHVFAFDDWFPGYAENGCNYARIWLSLEWNDLATITQKSGYDRIDLQRAWHMDHVLELAEQHGLALMLCFDAHGMLRSNKTLHGFWEMSPLHPDHGAPIEKPIEFFTNEKMLHAYRNRLQYLVARYGYSPSVFAWEFFNEVDLVDDYNSSLIAEWHRDMARYLRGIDPWKHLITTSFARSSGDPGIDGLAELDFVQTHHYQARDIAAAFEQDVAHKAAAVDRPHFHGEFGISHSGAETGELDPGGIHLRNGLYSSPGLMAAGTAMSWWWDSYIAPKNLYPIFGGFARWIEGFDFIDQQAKLVKAEFQWTTPGTRHEPGDFILNVSDVSWQPAPYNKPTKVTVSAIGKAVYSVKPAGILHGLRNHPTLHNPVTFDVHLDKPTRFIVEVSDVSGHGGAALEILLDGRGALKSEFVDATDSEKGGKLSQFAGNYTIDLPSGRHTVIVKCTGKDWLMVNAYRINGILLFDEPPLRALGVVGRTKALIWLQNPDYTWSNAQKADFKPHAVADSSLFVENLPPGRWIIEHWDTTSGKATKTLNIDVTATGPAQIELPPITWDHALKLHKR